MADHHFRPLTVKVFKIAQNSVKTAKNLMERATGFEPATPSSGSWCSASELRPLSSSTLYYVTLAATLKARGASQLLAPFCSPNCSTSANHRSKVLNASGSTVTYGDFVSFNDDRDAPLSSRILEQFLKILGVLLCVAIVNLVALLGVILTGRLSVRSASLTINDHDLFCHTPSLLIRVFQPKK